MGHLDRIGRRYLLKSCLCEVLQGFTFVQRHRPADIELLNLCLEVMRLTVEILGRTCALLLYSVFRMLFAAHGAYGKHSEDMLQCQPNLCTPPTCMLLTATLSLCRFDAPYIFFYWKTLLSFLESFLPLSAWSLFLLRN